MTISTVWRTLTLFQGRKPSSWSAISDSFSARRTREAWMAPMLEARRRCSTVRASATALPRDPLAAPSCRTSTVVDAADRGLAAEGGVGAVVIVGVKPVG
jgi:hypothetical protein